MRIFLKSAIIILCLWCGQASAAMFGDFLISDSLNPTQHSTPGHNNRTAVIVTPGHGTSIVLYLPTTAEMTEAGKVLEPIARRLDAGSDIAVFNLGGRPWFGTRHTMQGGVTFYDGYSHRNGVIYNVAFSMDHLLVPDADVKKALSQVRLMPNIPQSAVIPLLSRAMDFIDADNLDQADTVLEEAANLDASLWAVQYLRGMVYEGKEMGSEAKLFYSMAATLNPNDVPVAVKAAVMAAVTEDADAAVAKLAALADAHPEEAAIWEGLGSIYLFFDEMAAAQEYLETAIACNPSSESGLYNLSFIYAQDGDYEDALRRAREFYYYRPWMPQGTVPDVTGAPGFDGERIRDILNEPLPIGYIANYGGVSSQPLCDTETALCESLTPAPTPVYVEAPVYQTIETYVPVVVFDWSWSPRRHRPWRPGPNVGMHWPRPPGFRPGGPGHGKPRPPAPPVGPPHRPGRPPELKPPSSGGGRPPQGPGSRPPGGRPPSPGERPPGGGGQRPPSPGERPPGSGGQRPPSPGERPPGNGQRPPSGSGTGPSRPEPRPPSGITTLPGTLPGAGGTPTTRPTPPSSITTLPGRVPGATRPTPRPPMERPQPSRPARPATRPTPPVSGGGTGTATTTPAPAPTPGGGSPARPQPSAPERQRPSRPATPPSTARPAEESRPKPAPPASRPTPKPAPQPTPRPERKPDVTRERPQARPARPAPTPAPRERPAPQPAPKPTPKPAPRQESPKPAPPPRAKPAPKTDAEITKDSAPTRRRR